MNNVDSFCLGAVLGMFFITVCWCVYAWRYANTEKKDDPLGAEYAVVSNMASKLVSIETWLQSMAETQGMIYTKECASMEALIQIRDLIENPKASVGPVQSVVDYDRLDKIVLPLKDALFRIAADTEMGKKKFDVIAKVIGLDAKNDYANYIDERPEEPDKGVFEELVVEEMRGQGLSYHQAVDAVKGRMAHRSRARQ